MILCQIINNIIIVKQSNKLNIDTFELYNQIQLCQCTTIKLQSVVFEQKDLFPNSLEYIKQCEPLTGNDIKDKKSEEYIKLLMDECNCVTAIMQINK